VTLSGRALAELAVAEINPNAMKRLTIKPIARLKVEDIFGFSDCLRWMLLA
jgi:hypothetical protein